jgi:alkanesulfonate monooxygenase SsuD/methylene tetrahydromethanopterin reductase-like flavin-dependent oxidoreductase (luciferase family)
VGGLRVKSGCIFPIPRIANTLYDEILKQRVLYGTPAAVVERLQEYQAELGITGVVLEMNYGGQIPYDRVINSIRLLTEKVAPKWPEVGQARGLPLLALD